LYGFIVYVACKRLRSNSSAHNIKMCLKNKVCVWTGFIWFKIVPSGELLWVWLCAFGFQKCLGITISYQ
jgi:hypothetical protein